MRRRPVAGMIGAMPDQTAVLRSATSADSPAIRAVVEAAFGEQGRLVADLVNSLRTISSEQDSLELVAEREGAIAGHIMFTRNLLDAPRRLVDVQVLSPLSVRPDAQRQGIGAALIRRSLDLLAGRGVPLVFLEGHPGYYPRHGFVPGGEMAFRKPSLRIPDAAFQVCRLPAYEPWMTGTLVYAWPFWQHDCVGLRDPGA